MKWISLCLLSCFCFLSFGCQDKSIINIYDKEILKDGIPCMRLVVFPPNNLTTTTLQQLYHFEKKCDFKLEVSQKSGITCNSNQNSDKKALSNFPTSYLSLTLYKNSKIIYSYYIDLTHKVTKEDIKTAFKKVKKDLLYDF